MSLRPRRRGETQAQYNRRVDMSRQRTLGRPQKVERVSVTPVDMKATDRGRPVTKIGNRTIYEADMREAKANRQNLLQAQLRNLPEKATAATQKLPPELAEQLKKLQREAFRKIRQDQLRQQRQQQQSVNPRTGKPFTQQQVKQIMANRERQAREFQKKAPLAEKYMKGDIGVRELRAGGFKPQEIRNIEKGRIARQFMDGKITDRQLSRSGKFSLKEIRDIKRNAQFKRMSPEERRAFIEREQRRQLRRQRQPDRRRGLRRAYRRVRGGDRDNVITYQTTGRRRRVSPMQTQRRRRVAPTQRRRRGMRVPI